MTAFDAPDTTQWCPDCQRERLNCRHLDDPTATTDGGRDDLYCDGCGTAHGVLLVRVRDPDGIITTCADCEEILNSTIVEELDPDRIVADGGTVDTDEVETPAIDRAQAVHGKWLELVDAASKRDRGRVERLADELRGDLTFIERTIDDLDRGGEA